MRIHFTPDARESIRYKRAWWEANRDKAPGLFLEELRAVMAKIRTGADDERRVYTRRSGVIIWRILMPKTRHHVYYRVEQTAQLAEVLLVWNAQGGEQPTFPS